ncbi:hypothetical protein [Oribacterium sp. NK2B42]|uniref:hypothetical protein n=1 Tax=Oribacterium sp. NK2B42 TaxID=689781 RepID=UPI0004169806|nr:hypothetical protein [Oribacterium sp. NK2B42]
MDNIKDDKKVLEKSEDLNKAAETEFIDGFSGFEPIPDQDLKKVMGGQDIMTKSDKF